MHEPPFIVGKPVTGEYFIDREKELAKLKTLLSGVVSGKINNVMVLGLRRTGKTSLLVNVAGHITADSDKIVPVIYDCMGASTKSMFAKQFIDTVLQAYIQVKGDIDYKQKLSSAMKNGLGWARIHLSEFELEVAEYIKFRIKLHELKDEEDELVQRALKYPEELASAKGVSFVIMIDEFQELLKWGTGFLKILRTIIQPQRRVVYVFTGSAPTVIRDLIYKERSPFYKQLTEIRVSKLPEETVRKFVVSRLKKVKLNISNIALDQLVYHTNGFPDYVQRLGLNLYLRALSKRDWQNLEELDVEDCYEEMLTQLDGEFSTYFASFSDFEKNTLIALAKGNNSPTSIAAEIRKPLSSMPQILNRLINADVVEKYKEASYRVMDPVFSNWLARRYASFLL